ncbi:hypothetical protein ACFQV2_25140 [Actinokineospora soli]|uniref:Uncharacterized protein n=1 Tax=Actinokineospora soli TaxID=1048753 RepID=A0ABW2TSF6_9PSEU
MIGVNALFADIADPGDPVLDPTRDLEDRLAEVRARAAAGTSGRAGGWTGSPTASAPGSAC